MLLSKRIDVLSHALGLLMLKKNWKMVFAESCTGGALASAITQVAGSSDWFDSSLVTYSNAAKMHYLGVSPQVLAQDGAVSEACVLQMLKGIMIHPHFFGIAVTGFAGPTGGTEHEPKGTVYIAWQSPEPNSEYMVYHLMGSREEVIHQAVYHALRQAVLMSLCVDDWQGLHYFFALMSDDGELGDQCHAMALAAGLNLEQLEPKSNLHITLSYLGKIAPKELSAYQTIGENLSRMGFAFELNGQYLSYWEKPDAYVYELEAKPEVMALAHQLDAKQDFKPHITISKKASYAGQNVNLGTIQFKARFNYIVLLASFRGVFYIEQGRWYFKT